jgi:acyl carrier protein
MNSKQQIEAKVARILTEELDVPESQITPQARIKEDLGLDSLDAVILCMSLEEEFQIDIWDEQAEKLQTVGDITAFLEPLSKPCDTTESNRALVDSLFPCPWEHQVSAQETPPARRTCRVYAANSELIFETKGEHSEALAKRIVAAVNAYYR